MDAATKTGGKVSELHVYTVFRNHQQCLVEWRVLIEKSRSGTVHGYRNDLFCVVKISRIFSHITFQSKTTNNTTVSRLDCPQVLSAVLS